MGITDFLSRILRKHHPERYRDGWWKRLRGLVDGMNYKKNDVYTITIEDLGKSGEGIGRIDGYTLFVKDALPGDVIRAKITKANKNYGYARVDEIITPSPDRVTPICGQAARCGGCQIQALSYEAQLKFKQKLVENNLKRIGKVTDFHMNPIIGMDEPYAYRNKAQFPVGEDKEGNIKIGFYAGRTHSIIESDTCHIGIEENNTVIQLVKEHMERYGIRPYNELTAKGVVRHILIRKAFSTGELMVCIVINAGNIPHSEELVKSLLTVEGMTSISLNINKEKGNVILGKKLINLYGEGYITDKIGDVKFKISPLSFYQVNPVQTNRLYKTALNYAGLTGNETVWDLYCGIGTISLFLAQKAKSVKGVEIIPQAIDNANDNAAINNIKNAEFFVGKAEEVLPEYYNKEKEKGNNATADVIVVDPPRKGCDSTLLDTIVDMTPKRMVYVSCDSATLARDVGYLQERGYRVVEVQPVDMFPHTVHVETVCLLSKKP